MRTPRVPDPTDYWTPEEARLLLDEWQRSGGPLAAFARRCGVAPRRLYWWKKQLAGSPPASLSLIPATIVGSEAPASAPITVRLPSGIAIEIANASPSLVAAIVSELTRSQP
ncbi:MAG TPA: hypothetical protein VFW85_03115 [Gaiellaceae bacterium]|nr:hypothetical protein [Gaiellaceae bacterium]